MIALSIRHHPSTITLLLPFVVTVVLRYNFVVRCRLYIVMEMCSGGDLEKIVKKCKRNGTTLDEAIIWKVFAQATVALKVRKTRTTA